MRERVLRRDVRQLCARLMPEWATRSRHPETLDLFGILPDEALIDGAVLRIYRHETSRFCCQGHDDVPAHHERFLVRQRQHATRFQSADAGLEARSAHQRIHDHINLRQIHQPQCLCSTLRYMLHAEASGLFFHEARVLMARQSHHLKLVRMHGCHIQRLSTNGTGGS